MLGDPFKGAAFINTQFTFPSRETHKNHENRIKTKKPQESDHEGKCMDAIESDSENEEEEFLISSRQHQTSVSAKSEQNESFPSSTFQWPDHLNDKSAMEQKLLQPFSGDIKDLKTSIEETKNIMIRSVTWNQQAQDFPSIQMIQEHLLLPSYFHLVAVGTQECENSITRSMLYPSKVNWEKLCLDALGFEYELVRGHSLQASHL